MFRLDSAFYFGILLILIGISGYLYVFTPTRHYASVYILSSFALTSVLTFCITKQRFHLII
ncbi:MAG: hypothetical protein K2K31_00820, partial [Clostridia bacterium]|nr:hypothetical protein [Clostridia bacterium]